MRIKHTAARATAVALLATGGVAVGTATAAAGDGPGAPGGTVAPLLDWQGSDRAAPAEHDWGVAPMGDDHGSPGGGAAPVGDGHGSPISALERANSGIWG
ncbi:hypothetical protein [Streptomyces sp. B8F3]|uniref:hypothetical protein n=1 Tax=unclassified Streptomyces TaxID=2593676 RepID=UPI00325E35DF